MTAAARGRIVVGVLMCVVGLVWFFQGIGCLPGSFMTGQGFWTVVGVILFGLGLRMVVRARHDVPRAGSQ